MVRPRVGSFASHAGGAAPAVLVAADAAGGQECFKVPVINETGDGVAVYKPDGFVYARTQRPGHASDAAQRVIASLEGSAEALPASVTDAEYTEEGLLERSGFVLVERGGTKKIVGSGLRVRVEVFRTLSKGWGLRAGQDIEKGAFVCEYTGRICTSKEFDDAQSRVGNYSIAGQYCWSLDQFIVKNELTDEDDTFADNHELCIDGYLLGNVSRWINASTLKPNLHRQMVMTPEDRQAPAQSRFCYRVCFYAQKKIKRGDELLYDYGDSFFRGRNKRFGKKSARVKTVRAPELSRESARARAERAQLERVLALSKTLSSAPAAVSLKAQPAKRPGQAAVPISLLADVETKVAAVAEGGTASTAAAAAEDDLDLVGSLSAAHAIPQTAVEPAAGLPTPTASKHEDEDLDLVGGDGQACATPQNDSADSLEADGEALELEDPVLPGQMDDLVEAKGTAERRAVEAESAADRRAAEAEAAAKRHLAEAEARLAAQARDVATEQDDAMGQLRQQADEAERRLHSALADADRRVAEARESVAVRAQQAAAAAAAALDRASQAEARLSELGSKLTSELEQARAQASAADGRASELAQQLAAFRREAPHSGEKRPHSGDSADLLAARAVAKFYRGVALV